MVHGLSLREKIAQLFMIGFRGNDISEDSAILRVIEKYKPGGVILFDQDMVHHKPVHNIRSPEQVARLTKSLQEASAIPLLIATDQEGGIVQRLKPKYGFPETVSHQYLGQQNDLALTLRKSEEIAGVLKDAGINLNFAPVVDLSVNAESSIISKKERSFGDDPQRVTDHAEKFTDGHKKHGIISCIKHFPGHGSASGDTHAGFVDVSESWHESELIPYRTLIQKGKCPMIMTAHIFHKKWEDKLPATLSKAVLTGLLRKELGFEGVVISDDMQMRAISDHYSLKESLRLGLNAGLDMFCFGNNLLPQQIELSDAIQAVEELAASGEITQERIDTSADRILALKNDFGILTDEIQPGLR